MDNEPTPEEIKAYEEKTSREVAQIAGGFMHLTPGELVGLNEAGAKALCAKIRRVAASALTQAENKPG
jgi:hypothetical protein